MRIVLRYYQLLLVYNSRLISVQCSHMQNNPATSDPLIPSHVVWGYYEGKYLILNLKGSITPSSNVSAHLLTPVTMTFGKRSIRTTCLIGSGIRCTSPNWQRTRLGRCISIFSKHISGVLVHHIWEASVHTGGKACSVSLEYGSQVILNSSYASSSFL